eukprot:401312-Alexandrium_andersonii.AAC.1
MGWSGFAEPATVPRGATQLKMSIRSCAPSKQLSAAVTFRETCSLLLVARGTWHAALDASMPWMSGYA